MRTRRRSRALADAREQGSEMFICLRDVVGYGADARRPHEDVVHVAASYREVVENVPRTLAHSPGLPCRTVGIE